VVGIDVGRASGARFGPDPHDLLDRWNAFRAWAASAALPPPQPLDERALGPPVPRPRQVFAIGLNYRAHADEAGYGELPPLTATFTKFPTCLAGPHADVALPTPRVDWEVELVVAIGAAAERVPAADAWDVVAGVTVGQDLSARDIQHAGEKPQFSLGKSFAGFGPTGPWLVTPDELPERDALALSCALNGETVQRASTAEMLFAVPELIAALSGVCRLLPGDLIFTGTPAGVGSRRDPPRFLRAGDELVSEIDGIGRLVTRFVDGAAG
jgi:2-keto-4-pentenoate hydratase/2-oxohepta-3-ene-1,7-dioic acid hydratase in catechol pathway